MRWTLLLTLAFLLPVAPAARAEDDDIGPVVDLFELVIDADPDTAKKCLGILTEKIQTGEVSQQQMKKLKPRLQPLLAKVLKNEGTDHPLYLDAAFLATTWKDPAGFAAVRKVFAAEKQKPEQRLQALDALVAAGDDKLLEVVGQVLSKPQATSTDFRGQVLAALGRMESAEVADVVLKYYPQMDAELQPKAVELLTQRASWAKQLLSAIGRDALPASDLNVNQVRKLQASKDPELKKLVERQWGRVRTERNPQREQVIAHMRRFLREHEGDPFAGQKVFKKLCAQCHKIYGEGQEVGPDITRNGRASFEQLLSNVFDPSLVIGAAYQARTIITTDGRVLTGLVAEDNDRRVVLKMQGGKQEIIPRDKIDEMAVSKLSLMPENLEKQLKPEEIANLFAYITLDRPPSDPEATFIPGTQGVVPMQASDPSQFGKILSQIAPGFTIDRVGEGGLALLEEHMNRPGVLRTHPISKREPCVLQTSVKVPAGQKTRLALAVSHHPKGNWQLVVKADGKTLHESIVGEKTTKNGWREISIDLSRFAGKTVDLRIENRANNWAWEFAYFGRIELIYE